MSGPRGSVRHAIGDAFQWRLLLLWIAALALPTAWFAFPLWRALSGALAHAVDADALARNLDVVTMLEAAAGWQAAGDSPTAGLAGGVVLTLLLSPWLSGMALAAAAADPARPPGFAALARGGFAHYGRLARLLLWSAVPLGVVAVVGLLLRLLADRHAEHAILASDADLWRGAAWGITGLLLVVVQAGLDAGRARLSAEPGRPSAFRAWWRSMQAMRRRPVATLAPWLVTSALGLAAAGLLGIVRLRIPPLGVGGFLLAWLTTQLAVGALAWARCARLFALRDVALRDTIGPVAP